VIAAALLGLALQADTRARVLAVRSETVEGRGAVRVMASRPMATASVRRAGDEIVLVFDADPPVTLGPIPVVPPLTSVRLERAGMGLVLRIGVPLSVPYELRREGSAAVIVFGAPIPRAPSPSPVPAPSASPAPAPSASPAPAPSASVPAPSASPSPTPSPTLEPDVADLYRRILPPPPPDVPGLAPGGGQVAAPAEGDDEDRSGWNLGPLSFRPSVDVTYVDAEGSILDTPVPVRDRYLEVQPRAAFTLLLWKLKLASEYAPRLRFGSSFEQNRSTTHSVELNVEVPLGTRVLLRGAERYAQGTLETTEVDPGREYFFQLGRYVTNTHHAGLRLDTSALVDIDAAGTLTRVRVDDQSGFFDYETRQATVAAAYDVRPTLTSYFGYVYTEVPPSEERRIIESRAQTAEVRLQGEVLPLVDGELRVGYQWQEAPRAGPGGERFRGVVTALRLTKAFAPDTRLSLRGERQTHPSAFEDNAFYVSNSVLGDLTAPLPLEVALHLGGGYHRNDYRTPARDLGRPRRDELFGWSVGLGRPFTRWAYVRADYRKERRDSNVDAFDSRSRAFTVQMGLGVFRTAVSR
jgi:hypothetical protein